MELPTIGRRFNLAGYLGTVNFVGSVDNTSGIWLGVEWDDPSRGKHDGVKDGKRYFTCRVPGSGSFIRPSSSLNYGQTFLEALRSRYIELPHKDDSQETVLLGSSKGAILVEAVNLDKIRRKLSNLANLREASLDGENVAYSDPPGEIRKCCPSIRGLNISASLISTWDTVADIASELPLLERLALNRNRFCIPTNPPPSESSAFSRLQELQLNRTLMTWAEMQIVTANMPKLNVVELGYNGLSTFPPSNSPVLATNVIRVLNLDGNQCDDWSHVCEALRAYPALQRVVLASNRIDKIPHLGESDLPLSDLKSLSLSFNQLKEWSDIDSLSLWLPALETLSLIGNPLVEDSENSRFSRQFVIAKIPSLLTLDAGPISAKERVDSELFYLSYIAKRIPDNPDQVLREHPRWRELLAKHGMTDSPPERRLNSERLGDRLIQIKVHQCSMPPSALPLGSPENSLVVPLRVLPSMSLRVLRIKILKTLGMPRNASIDLWLKMTDGNYVQIPSEHDAQDLSWWGIENGSDVFVYIPQ